MESAKRSATGSGVSRHVGPDRRDGFEIAVGEGFPGGDVIGGGQLDEQGFQIQFAVGPANGRHGAAVEAVVQRGPAAVVIAHNHPSGDPTPSSQDIACTRELSAAGKIIGIDLGTTNSCVAFVDSGEPQVIHQPVPMVPLDEIPGLIAAGKISHALVIAAFYLFEAYTR